MLRDQIAENKPRATRQSMRRRRRRITLVGWFGVSRASLVAKALATAVRAWCNGLARAATDVALVRGLDGKRGRLPGVLFDLEFPGCQRDADAGKSLLVGLGSDQRHIQVIICAAPLDGEWRPPYRKVRLGHKQVDLPKVVKQHSAHAWTRRVVAGLGQAGVP